MATRLRLGHLSRAYINKLVTWIVEYHSGATHLEHTSCRLLLDTTHDLFYLLGDHLDLLRWDILEDWISGDLFSHRYILPSEGRRQLVEQYVAGVDN